MCLSHNWLSNTGSQRGCVCFKIGRKSKPRSLPIQDTQSYQVLEVKHTILPAEEVYLIQGSGGLSAWDTARIKEWHGCELC